MILPLSSLLLALFLASLLPRTISHTFNQTLILSPPNRNPRGSQTAMANSSLPLSLVDSRLPETLLSKRRRLASTPATSSSLPSTADELLHYLGMKFEPSPSLPLKVTGFNFLKSISLSSVGLALEEIPFNFGWKLVEFRPSGVEPRDESRWDVESGWEDQIHGVDIDIDVLDLNEPRTGREPDLELETEHPNFEGGELDSPITQTTPPIPQRSRKRRLKTTAGRTDLPSSEHVQFFDSDQTVFPPVPQDLSPEKRESESKTHKKPTKPTTTRPTRKSSRTAFQTRPRSSQQSSTPD